MKPLWLRSLLWIIVFACLLGAQTLFAADAPPAIQFADEAALSVKWPEGKIAFAVQNNTTADLTLDIHVEAFAASGARVEAAEIIQPAVMTMTLPAAGSAWIAMPLVVKPALLLAPGSYTSVAVVAEKVSNSVIRKPITLTVTDPAAVITSPLLPALDAYTIRAYRLCPFAPPWCASNCAVPVQEPPTIAAPPAGTLGYLLGDEGGALQVSLASYTQTVGARLAYDFTSGWGLAGAYTGKVDLAPKDAAQGELDLTVSVTDAIWYPILLLTIGVFITAWTQNWLGVRRPLWQLVRREAEASKVMQEAKPIAGYDISTDALHQLQAISAEAQALDRIWLNLLFAPGEADAAKERHAQLEARLAGVEKEIDLWQRWPQKLSALEQAIQYQAEPAIIKAQQRIPPTLPAGQTQPQFYTEAVGLTTGEALKLAQFAQKAVALDHAVTLARQWGGWEEALAQARGYLDVLQGMTAEEEKVAARARQQANSAWVDLWTAADLDELAERNTKAEITAAVDGANRLLHRLPRVAAAPSPAEKGMKMEEGAIAGAVLPILPVADLPVEPGARAERAASALRLGDRAFLGIAVVVALATGLTQLYFGKNFGSFQDWLAALTWGAGSKLGVDLVKTAMDRLFTRA